METDRSRIIAFQRCPRERYLAFHAHGTGLQKKSKGIALQFGSAFHEGAEVLLSMADIEEAVGRAQGFLINQFAAKSIAFEGEIPDDAQKAMEYGREEQMALAEALLRSWWSYEGQAFLENFEVIEVEREGRANLTNPSKWEFTQPYGPKYGSVAESDALTLMFRPDALVRDRMSGDLYIVSWKTCATFSKRSVDQARHDMQSMSEVWGVEQTFPNDYETQAHIEGVLYKWIVKGRRNKDDWDGLYKQDTHLIYGWRKLGTGRHSEDIPPYARPESTSSYDDDWSWSYKWKDDEINQKTGRPIGHTLGKGWQKVPIWREYPGGVKAWIEDLSQRRVFPRHVDPFVSVFPQALPVERRADEVERWKRQVIQQEKVIQGHLEGLANLAGDHSEMLDYSFPQHTHSCHSYSGCPFIPICWDGMKAEVGELYQIRSANHPEKGDDNE